MTFSTVKMSMMCVFPVGFCVLITSSYTLCSNNVRRSYPTFMLPPLLVLALVQIASTVDLAMERSTLVLRMVSRKRKVPSVPD